MVDAIRPSSASAETQATVYTCRNTSGVLQNVSALPLAGLSKLANHCFSFSPRRSTRIVASASQNRPAIRKFASLRQCRMSGPVKDPLAMRLLYNEIQTTSFGMPLCTDRVELRSFSGHVLNVCKRKAHRGEIAGAKSAATSPTATSPAASSAPRH